MSDLSFFRLVLLTNEVLYPEKPLKPCLSLLFEYTAFNWSYKDSHLKREIHLSAKVKVNAHNNSCIFNDLNTCII